MTEPTTLASKPNVDTGHATEVIQQTYRQVFGNRHLMELDVNSSIEALFMNGDLTVQGFVWALAQSETTKNYSLRQTVPISLLNLISSISGRPPHDQVELMNHVRLLQDEGFEAEIALSTAKNIFQLSESIRSHTTEPQTAWWGTNSELHAIKIC